MTHLHYLSLIDQFILKSIKKSGIPIIIPGIGFLGFALFVHVRESNRTAFPCWYKTSISIVNLSRPTMITLYRICRSATAEARVCAITRGEKTGGENIAEKSSWWHIIIYPVAYLLSSLIGDIHRVTCQTVAIFNRTRIIG